MREAPSRRLIAALLARGATVRAYDPVAIDEARRVFAMDLQQLPEARARLHFVTTQDETLTGADALVIVTEWKEFKSPDFVHLKSELKSPLIFDGRNLYEPDAMTELGIDYHSIGRPYVSGSTQPDNGAGHA
jgi:UDPglucose 6-dehydrogenase